MKIDPNIYTFLDMVRERPSMYAQSLSELESQIIGYYSATKIHGIVEPVPSLNHHFLIWVHCRTQWSTSAGWAMAIESHIKTLDKQFARFFALVDEYRRLRPTTLCLVNLKLRHNPTGKRVVYGIGGRMEKPDKVEIIRYKPMPLHFLRFHYPGRIDDGWLLIKSDGICKSTLRDAKRWVGDELQVKNDEWEPA